MTAFGDRFRAGVNLGGWLSQYQTYDHDHFERFITEADIERIASWGMDHVRLPVDYPVLDGTAGDFDARGLGYVDDCLAWCRDNNLNLVVDLHRAPGYSFSDPDDNRLFEDDDLQDHFVDLWRELASRYETVGETLAFELLNEVVDPPGDAWHALACRAVEAIHAVDPDRDVVVGGPEYNAVHTLDEIDPIADDHVVYTFHFYEPKLFTHQHAPWMAVTDDYATTVEYPGTCPDLDAFLVENPKYAPAYEEFVGERFDRAWIEDALRPAVEFRAETGAELYCGEFGAIDRASMESRIAWYRDVVDVLRELGIGRACWSYREMDFGLLDDDREIVNDDLVEIVSRA